jgi:Sec-independent protein secretion pathway component TatC
MLLCTAPILGLYEIGIILCWLTERKRNKRLAG